MQLAYPQLKRFEKRRQINRFSSGIDGKLLAGIGKGCSTIFAVFAASSLSIKVTKWLYRVLVFHIPSHKWISFVMMSFTQLKTYTSNVIFLMHLAY